MKSVFLIAVLVVIYYNVSGLATTNILRLTAGNSKPVLSSVCTCDHCGAPIDPLRQQPVLSYLICKGRCRNCKCKIPVDALMLEILIWSGMFVLTAVFSWSVTGVTMSFAFYELIRIGVIIKMGRRERGFPGQYIIAVLSMVPHYLTALFVALLFATV